MSPEILNYQIFCYSNGLIPYVTVNNFSLYAKYFESAKEVKKSLLKLKVKNCTSDI